MHEDRLIEIETKLSHQEVLLEELSEVLRQQQKSIQSLEQAVKRLRKDLPGEQGKALGPGNEKPPHY